MMIMKLTSLLTTLLFLFIGTQVHAQCIEGDCIDGQGTYLFKNNSAKYTGSFQSGKPHGEGSCKYASGDLYIGSWSEGLFSGSGKLKLNSGSIRDGIWEKGKFISEKPTPSAIELQKELVNRKPVQKIWALVVGVASYEHMPALRYADDDAWLFYSNLISTSGAAVAEGQVNILIDESATRENILNGLESLSEKAGENDLVIFYYSGHGYEGAFLPIDYDGFTNKLFHSEVNSILAKTKAKQKICIADACHSGSLFAAKGASQEAFLNLYREFTSVANNGTALMLSSKSKETSLESKGLRHGVFTYFLVKGLKGAADSNLDKTLELQELFDYVYQSVREYTAKMQTPSLNGNFDPKFPIRSLD